MAAALDPATWLFALIGAVAQLFDGVLGMGFGVISSTALTAVGYPREVVSASVNGAKMFTGLAGGASHIWYRNIDWRLFAILCAGGVIGGAFGAFLLRNGADGQWVGPFISAYLIGAGVYIILQATREERHRNSGGRTGAIGFAGGLLEAISGVWGPLVTSSLVALGVPPRFAVGTGNLAETVIAVTVFSLLVHHVGLENLSQAVLGLLVGALIASPIAARLTVKAPKRRLMVGVGVLVIATSVIRLVRDMGVFL